MQSFFFFLSFLSQQKNIIILIGWIHFERDVSEFVAK